MARRGVLAATAGAAALLLGGCNPFYSSASYRYRMTVEGEHQGSAVYEVLAERTRAVLLPEEKPGGSLLKGQALVIETSSGPVFALLKSGDDSVGLISSVTHALAPDIPMGGQPNFWKAVKRLGGWFGGAKGELPREDWPLLVRFRNINDPKSVEKVSPDAIGMKRILLETTSDDVTTGIEKRLAWFAQYLDRHLDGTSTPTEDLTTNNLSSHMSSRSFSTDIHK